MILLYGEYFDRNPTQLSGFVSVILYIFNRTVVTNERIMHSPVDLVDLVIQ